MKEMAGHVRHRVDATGIWISQHARTSAGCDFLI
jgi:hypothetical protein